MENLYVVSDENGLIVVVNATDQEHAQELAIAHWENVGEIPGALRFERG